MSTISRSLLSLAFLMVCLQFVTPVMAQNQDLIVDICTTPNKYWNKQVFLKGHVIRVTPDPPGTNRGRFTLRDQSDKDIEVATDELPAMGKVYTINGTVIQGKPGETVPVIREGSRALAEPAAGMPENTGVARQAAPPAAQAPAAASGRPLSKKELEDAVRRELDQREAQARQAQAAAPPVTAPPPVPSPVTVLPPAPAAGMWESPYMILGLVAVIVAIVAVLIVALRGKPAPVAQAPAAQPAYAPPPMAHATASSAGAQTMQAPPKSMPTMVASAATQVVIPLGAELSIVEGPDRGRSISLNRPVTTIGRTGARKNDVELSDGTISREQAKILYNSTDRSFTLVNEATTNPTRVNGNAVISVPLSNNDKIEFGNTAIRFLKS